MTIQQVREQAREQAKDIDRYAVCCSDGAFEFARTEDVAADIRDAMQARHEARRPDVAFKYDTIALDTDGEAR